MNASIDTAQRNKIVNGDAFFLVRIDTRLLYNGKQIVLSVCREMTRMFVGLTHALVIHVSDQKIAKLIDSLIFNSGYSVFSKTNCSYKDTGSSGHERFLQASVGSMIDLFLGSNITGFNKSVC